MVEIDIFYASLSIVVFVFLVMFHDEVAQVILSLRKKTPIEILEQVTKYHKVILLFYDKAKDGVLTEDEIREILIASANIIEKLTEEKKKHDT